MGLISNRVEKRYLKPGDHIYSWRIGLAYSHHGIYKGEEQVVHFTSSSLSSPSPSLSLSPSPSPSPSPSSVPGTRASCSACEMLEHGDRKSGVIVSCLDCFIKSGKLYLYEYGVSKRAYSLRRLGTCNTAESGRVEVVMERALHLLQHNGFGDYHLLNNNCEDFATFCKTGQTCNRNGTAGRYGQASLLRRLLCFASCRVQP